MIILEKCDILTARWKNEKVVLNLCGQQPKIIKTCVCGGRDSSGCLRGYLQGMNFHAWHNARVQVVPEYLQMQFKCTHVLLIALIEIYMNPVALVMRTGKTFSENI